MAATESVLIVRGAGAFPVDMLRYDGCYPLTEDDAYAIQRSIAGASHRKPWTVRVVRRRNNVREARSWTLARWRSFSVEVHVEGSAR